MNLKKTHQPELPTIARQGLKLEAVGDHMNNRISNSKGYTQNEKLEDAGALH